jgi:hypothetical protein
MHLDLPEQHFFGYFVCIVAWMGKICQRKDQRVYRSITPEVFDGFCLYCCRSACDYL